MKIYELESQANKYDYFVIGDDKVVDQMLFDYKFDGNRVAHRWQPVKVKIDEKDERPCDKPTFSYGPVFSRRALDILGDIIGSNVEILPLIYEKGDYYLINVINLLDCINYEKAQYIPFSSGRPMRFVQYSFKENLVKSVDIFKIVEFPKVTVFVSEKFKEVVTKNKLTGFKFIEVWDSEKE